MTGRHLRKIWGEIAVFDSPFLGVEDTPLRIKALKRGQYFRKKERKGPAEGDVARTVRRPLPWWVELAAHNRKKRGRQGGRDPCVRRDRRKERNRTRLFGALAVWAGKFRNPLTVKM